MKKYIKLISIGGIGLILCALIYFFSATSSVGNGENQVDFQVKPGWGSIVVISQLHKQGLIKSRTFFRLLLMLKGKSTKIKLGIYALNDGMSSGEIIDVITSGRTKLISITIPEGYNNRQIGDVFTEKGFFKSRKEFLEYASDQKILQKYKIAAKTTEGYLFPDTYSMPKGFSKSGVIEAMVKNFFKKVKDIEGFPKSGKELQKLVILSSIVEREAQLKEERALIAGVFKNRLKANYPLESCATIQYLFEKPRRRIYFRDLERPSPYNTYIHKGLPPGPISNPGLHAIKAAFKPEKTDYRFFVVKGDGSHYFFKYLCRAC